MLPGVVALRGVALKDRSTDISDSYGSLGAWKARKSTRSGQLLYSRFTYFRNPGARVLAQLTRMRTVPCRMRGPCDFGDCNARVIEHVIAEAGDGLKEGFCEQHLLDIAMP